MAAKKTKTASKGRKLGDIINIEGVKNLYRADNLRFFVGLALLIASLFMLLAFTSNIFTGAKDQAGVEAHSLRSPENYGGTLGAYIAYYFMTDCFGFAALFIPVFLTAASMKLMKAYKIRLWKWFLNCSIPMIWLSITMSILERVLPNGWLKAISFPPGGKHGNYMLEYMEYSVGFIGAIIIMVAITICYLFYLNHETKDLVRKALNPRGYGKNDEASVEVTDGGNVIDEDNANLEGKDYTNESTVKLDLDNEVGQEKTPPIELDLSKNTPVAEPKPKPSVAVMSVGLAKDEAKADVNVLSSSSCDMRPYDPRLDLENYKFPGLDLLKKYSDNAPTVDMAEQNSNKDRIITILRNFGVEITSIKATIGPTITLYEITPAQGVRISKIRNLEDDIALSLSAIGIRIIAPIPGKGTIGIEVPNKNPRIVSMESILNSKRFQECRYELPIALGKTITNEVFMVDLAKMPHLLVAGATGQGKSVGLNAIITSLLYKKHPSELKFVMIDPKKVEFSVYSPIENHFLAKLEDNEDPIITDVTKVVQTLKSLCQLMDHRYDLLKKAKVRNIKEYNAKFRARQLNPEKGHEFMPYIVVIIDEFGDLIMTAGKEVELPIARIAQLARAVGMHMVIATQRPTTNIITGTIKANFPARMAFKVMSQIDSRTILDRPGANQLVGRGDMLFLSGNDPVRVQCAFVDTPEVEKITAYISEQQGYVSAFALPEVAADGDASFGSSKGGLDTGNLDPMFEEAARLVVINQKGSTSLIQRKFSIGYNRAGRLMDQLEKAGIVGPEQGSKPRDVLCVDETDLEAKLSNIRQ